MTTVPENDIGRIVIDRLEAAFPQPAIFSADEISEWPDGALTALEAAALLQETVRAAAVMCDGCHWCCHKPVEVRRHAVGQVPYVYIICDEEPNLGRIEVSWDRLRQYRTTLNSLAGFLRMALGLTASAPLSSSPPLLVGHIKGRWKMCSVSLLLEDRSIMLMIGSHSKPVPDFLACGDGQLTADERLLRKLANRKQGTGSARPRYQPSRIKQETQVSDTARRDRAIRAEAHRIRKETGKTMSEISRELADKDRFRRTGPGKQPLLSAARIYRIIHDQRRS